MTLHETEGPTVDTALIVGSDTVARQAGYVALSPGAHANHFLLRPQDLHDLSTDCSSDPRPDDPGAADLRERLQCPHREGSPSGRWRRS
jgi:hypothetical protein